MRLAKAIEELQAALYAEIGGLDDEEVGALMSQIEDNHPLLLCDSEERAKEIKQYIHRHKIVLHIQQSGELI